MTASRRRAAATGAGAAVAVVLGTATTAAIAHTGPGPDSVRPDSVASIGRCAVPALPGAVVDVGLSDMGAMMGPGHGPGPMRGDSHWWRHMPMRGMMRLSPDPVQVPAGPVSLRAINTGGLTHEVVVLPLPTGQGVGQRPVGGDEKVDETGSLGEASRTCGAGTGHGITPGTAGWTTLTLHPGRYELICNLPGHYAAGMYAELDVTG